MEMKKRVLSVLITLVLLLGLLPGMGLTAYADTSIYTAFIATKSDTDSTLPAKQVTFNDYKWYIIADDSTNATEPTVTLLAADTRFGYSKSGERSVDYTYSASKVKKYLDAMTSEGAFKDVADVIADTDLDDRDDKVKGAKLYLLSYGEALALSPGQPYQASAVLKMAFTEGDCDTNGYWWLCTRGAFASDTAIVVNGVAGEVHSDTNALKVDQEYGVRPALRLKLSSVIFSAEKKSSFLLGP